MSVEKITVKSVQLIDGESGEGADLVTLGTDLDAGLTRQWTVDVTGAGIHSPTAVFTFIYQGGEHTCSANYRSVEVSVVSRP